MLKALAAIGSDDALKFIIEKIGYQKEGVMEAIQVFVKIDIDRIGPALVKQLNHEDDQIRLCASAHLGDKKSRDAVPRLLELLDDVLIEELELLLVLIELELLLLVLTELVLTELDELFELDELLSLEELELDDVLIELLLLLDDV